MCFQGCFHYATPAGTHVYTGQFVDGLRQGRGTMKYASGDVYEGEFAEDCIAGKGKMKWDEGKSVYVGQWVDGRPNGEGVHVEMRTLNGRPLANRYEG